MAQYPAFSLPPSVLQALSTDPTNTQALAEARQVLGPNYIQELIAASKAPPSEVQFLQQWGPIVEKAAQDGQLPAG